MNYCIRVFLRSLTLSATALVLLASLPAEALDKRKGKSPPQTSSGGRRFESVAYFQTVPDKGDLTVEYKIPSNKKLAKIAQSLKESRVLDQVIRGINEAIALPKDLKTVVDTCDEPNAYYHSDARQITICLELLSFYTESFSKDDSLSKEEVAEHTIQATVFTLFHEVGHALVDVYELPITGKEEDAVDDLAALLGLAVDQEGGLLWSAILDYAASAEVRDNEDQELPFWGEHSLDEQRMYNIACIMFGSDPEGFAQVVDDDWLPESRAELCPDEYVQKERSWGTLLAPYLKE
jgi:hypothetical protein